MRGHVFISYSEKDKTFAEMLLGALEERGTKCWIAPRDIPPGGSYADAIMRAIEECSCFVLTYTVHSNSSPHVLREVERALKIERNIIPVRFDQSEPSRSLDYLLATVHWLSIDTSTAKAAVSRVADQISACVPPAAAIAPPSPLQAAAPEPSVLAPSTAERPGISKFVVVGVMVALLIVGAISFSRFVGQKSAPKQAAQKLAALPSPATSQPKPAARASVPPESAAQRPAVSLPSATPTVAPTKTIEQSAQVRTGSTPQNVLQRYFASFAERDPVAAYNLLSTGFRSNMSFKKYSVMFSSTREIKLNEANLLSQTENNATVLARFQETDADYHQAYWQGPIEFVRENGQWRIKTLRELKKVPAPAETVPVRPPNKAWDKPHVYLELANESQRTTALDLKQRLTRFGYEVVEIESVSRNVDIPTETSEVRYFSTGDAAEAQRIAQEVQAFFSSTGIVAYLPEGMPHVSHSRQYEIWFSSAFH